jgi:endonuclease/exonuclease/phosphatase (EEP) superfamily protein YafD
MRTTHAFAFTTLAAAAAAALSAAGCMNHPIPADRSIESTSPATPREASLPRDFRVVAFNVHMEPGAHIASAFQADRALRDADLIMMEEVHRPGTACSGACELGRQLGDYAVFAPGHVNGDGTDGVAIVSKAPILSAEVIELPQFNVHVNGGRRIAMSATLLVDNAPVTVYVVHLENRLDVADRRTQMTPVLRLAAAQTNPVIIGGDFNTSPFTWIAHLIPILTTTQDDRFEELVRSYGLDTPVKDSGATHRALAMKLDGIYTRGFKTTKFATADGKGLSDHLALWADVSEVPAK